MKVCQTYTTNIVTINISSKKIKWYINQFCFLFVYSISLLIFGQIQSHFSKQFNYTFKLVKKVMLNVYNCKRKQQNQIKIYRLFHSHRRNGYSIFPDLICYIPVLEHIGTTKHKHTHTHAHTHIHTHNKTNYNFSNIKEKLR